MLRSVFQSKFALAALKSQGLLSLLCLTVNPLVTETETEFARSFLNDATRKIHMLPWSSSLGISPSLIAEMDTAFNPSVRPCRGEQRMSSICIYEEMKMEKSWAFGFCPLLSFTLNVCPGFAVPLHIVLAWTDRALFSVLTYRGIILGPGVLCIT